MPAAEFDGWRVVVNLRNADMHRKPAVPSETWQGGYFAGYLGGYMGNMFGDSPAQTVAHPVTGNRTKIVELGECALRVVNRLRADYRGL